jgi:hypothetical protein
MKYGLWRTNVRIEQKNFPGHFTSPTASTASSSASCPIVNKWMRDVSRFPTSGSKLRVGARAGATIRLIFVGARARGEYHDTIIP